MRSLNSPFPPWQPGRHRTIQSLALTGRVMKGKMKIETKYSVGDKVWRLASNQVLEDRINAVRVVVSGDHIEGGGIKARDQKARYDMNCGGEAAECDLFPSKAALLASL